jgi:hypothetical protein
MMTRSAARAARRACEGTSRAISCDDAAAAPARVRPSASAASRGTPSTLASAEGTRAPKASPNVNGQSSTATSSTSSRRWACSSP